MFPLHNGVTLINFYPDFNMHVPGVYSAWAGRLRGINSTRAVNGER